MIKFLINTGIELKGNSKCLFVFMLFFLQGCKLNKTDNDGIQESKTSDTLQVHGFEADYNFLKEHTEILLLENETGNGKIAIAPALQARVMTSTANGRTGNSYGWINREHFISGDTLEHINAFGGEERFWLGPEGGQYSIFFKKGDDFTLENWFTPRLIDLEPFELVEHKDSYAQFKKSASITNYSNFTFDLQISRSIFILSNSKIDSLLNIKIPTTVNSVGYCTENTLQNVGNIAWNKKNGLLSVWILGMLKHSPTTTVVIPYVSGNESSLGPVVNDDYFGEVPPDRLKVTSKAIYYKADGMERGKIGVGPLRSMDVMGSYDSSSNTLTIVKFNKPLSNTNYVNSKWEIQKEPYQGDVINAYNDGPPSKGVAPLGPFYELETSSPAAELKVGQELVHRQFTFHFEGEIDDLDLISQKVLGVSINDINRIFK